MNFDDNIALAADGISTICRHCSTTLGSAAASPLAAALHRESATSNLGPGIRADPKLFTDREIVLRQSFCPKCLTVLSTQVVPRDEANMREWKVAT